LLEETEGLIKVSLADKGSFLTGSGYAIIGSDFFLPGPRLKSSKFCLATTKNF
jgi:hypothetical protein